jgi:mediator of replication checkpoint protein 1
LCDCVAKDERTRAYYEAYQKDVQDDDNEDFRHLEQDDMDEGSDNDENAVPQETVSAAELQAQLREAARQKQVITGSLSIFGTITTGR